MIGKQLGRDQLILVDAMGYSGIRKAKEDKGSAQPHWGKKFEGLRYTR